LTLLINGNDVGDGEASVAGTNGEAPSGVGAVGDGGSCPLNAHNAVLVMALVAQGIVNVPHVPVSPSHHLQLDAATHCSHCCAS
jgi:hypothetical protein